MQIKRISDMFEKEGSVATGRKKGLAYRCGKEQKTRRVEEYVKRDPSISIRQCSRETGLPSTTVFRILKREFKKKAYKLQILQKIYPTDYQKRVTYAKSVLDKGNDFINRIVFSDESTFHLSGKVFRHNCRIWGTEKPTGENNILQHDRNSPKVNVLCGLSNGRVYGPFFFQHFDCEVSRVSL